jgi:hypothetical protein
MFIIGGGTAQVPGVHLLHARDGHVGKNTPARD